MSFKLLQEGAGFDIPGTVQEDSVGSRRGRIVTEGVRSSYIIRRRTETARQLAVTSLLGMRKRTENLREHHGKEMEVPTYFKVMV